MRVDGEAIDVLDATNDGLENLIRLNSVAQKVWELLERTLTIPDIADIIASEFDIPRETALTRTIQMLEIFNRADLASVSSNTWTWH